MGLIGAAFRPHSIGSQIIIMVPTDFLRKQSSWLAATSKYKCAMIGRLNFVLELDVRKILVEKWAKQDQSN